MAEPTPRQFNTLNRSGSEGSKETGVTPVTPLKEPRIYTKFNKDNPVHQNLLRQSSESAPVNKNVMAGGEDVALHAGGYFSLPYTPQKKTESKPARKAVARKAHTTKESKPVAKPAPTAKRKSNMELAQERIEKARQNKLIK